MDAGGVIGQALRAHIPKLIPESDATWRSAVSIIVRWTQPVPSARDIPLRGFLKKHAGSLEVLFIHRSSRDGDPWSGHIGFPGGRREQGDSSDFECAIRETREELGIDVGDTDFYEPLGRLDDAPIPVARAGQRRGVLCAFVFLERPPVADGHDIAVDGTPELVLDPAEVSAVLWVPVSCLLQGSPARVEHVFTIRPKLLGVVGALPPRVLRLLGLHRAVYAAVDVFSASTEIVDTEDVGSDLAPDDELGYGDENKTVSARKTPVLWGLSMRAVSDMVAILGGNRLDRPPFVFGNRVVATIYRVVFFIGRRLSFLRGPLQPFRRRNRRIT